jgi:hypothetical protein
MSAEHSVDAMYELRQGLASLRDAAKHLERTHGGLAGPYRLGAVTATADAHYAASRVERLIAMLQGGGADGR